MVGLPQLVILFVTDQFCYDAFSPEITPNLHKLSLEHNATIFTNAYVSTPTCTPARASLLTGKSPWAHGMLGCAPSVSCKKYSTTLPSMLSELAGHDAFTVGKNHFGWDKGQCVTHGFQHLKTYEALDFQPPDDYTRYFHERHPNVDPLDVTCHHLGYNDWRACPYGNSNEAEHPTDWTSRQALNYLKNFDFKDEDDKDNRMFLKVSYHRPHSPYDPPLRLMEKYLFNKNKIPKRFINNASWDQRFQNTSAMTASDFHGDPGEQAAEHTRAGYLASVEFVDEGVGLILDWLEGHDNNLLDNSLIIWTSDHGDMNEDHNLWQKGYPYEASTHVNLIVKLPHDDDVAQEQSLRRDSISGIEPRTSQALVETRDVAVTIYDYLGILDQVRQRDPWVNGKSLMPIFSGKASRVRDWLDLEHAIVCRNDIHWNAIVGFYPDQELSKKEDMLWKCVFHVENGNEQLFCLSKDPNETCDLTRIKGGVLKHFRETMVGQFDEENRGTDWVRDGKLTVHRPSITHGLNFPCRM